MIQNAVMDPYNINRIIILSITKKIEDEMDRDKRELNSLSITKKYKYSS